MLTKRLVTALAAAGFAISFAIAQEEKPANSMMGSEMMGKMSHDDMMSMMGKPKGDQGPSSTAFAKANAAMHSAMNIEFSGNADVDFAKGMIAHHEGAIEMSKVVLEFGKDAEMKKLAEQIIAAQGPEIEQMKAWLAKQ
jgi:uncharacterized protein (DUF305 family)